MENAEAKQLKVGGKAPDSGTVKMEITPDYYTPTDDGPLYLRQWRDRDGELHRDNGPAFIRSTLAIDPEHEAYEGRWYRHGKLHREDGPAVIFTKHNERQWYYDGKLHRENGPAVENDSLGAWYRDGKLHRDDGPALQRIGGIGAGHEEWLFHGKPHRTEGPAVINSDGTNEWWIDGEQLSETEFKHWQKKAAASNHKLRPNRIRKG